MGLEEKEENNIGRGKYLSKFHYSYKVWGFYFKLHKDRMLTFHSIKGNCKGECKTKVLHVNFFFFFSRPKNIFNDRSIHSDPNLLLS